MTLYHGSSFHPFATWKSAIIRSHITNITSEACGFIPGHRLERHTAADQRQNKNPDHYITAEQGGKVRREHLFHVFLPLSPAQSFSMTAFFEGFGNGRQQAAQNERTWERCLSDAWHRPTGRVVNETCSSQGQRTRKTVWYPKEWSVGLGIHLLRQHSKTSNSPWGQALLLHPSGLHWFHI